MRSNLNLGSARALRVGVLGVLLAAGGVASAGEDSVLCGTEGLLSQVEIEAYVRQVIIRDELAFVCAHDQGLLIYDISDPAQPFLRSQLEVPHGCFDVYLDGDMAYCSVLANRAARNGTIWAVDISDPDAPVLIRDYGEAFELAVDLCVRGPLAYIANDYNGFRIKDLSVPGEPVTVGAFFDAMSFYRVEMDWPMLYTISSRGLVILDVTNPSAPVRRGGEILIDGRLEGIAVADSVVYVTRSNIGSTGVILYAVDVSDPDAPEVLGSIDLSDLMEREQSVFRRMSASGSRVYLPTDEDAMVVVDFSDPASPQLLGAYQTPGKAMAVAPSGEVAAVLDNELGLQFFDVASPTLSSALLSSVETESSVNGVNVEWPYAYVAEGEDGLSIVDVRVPGEPVVVGSYDSPGVANEVVVRDGVAYVADDLAGTLQIVDVSDSASPELLGSVEMIARARGLDVQGDNVYLAVDEMGVVVYDVSDPGSPTLSSIMHTGDDAVRLDVSGDLVYVANSDDGLAIYDVSNPVLPEVVGVYREESGEPVLDVQVVGTLAYVAQGEAGLAVVDVEDPTSPVLIGSFSWAGECVGVHVAFGRAYLATEDGGMQVVSVADPTDPVFLGWHNASRVEQVDVFGDVAYVAAGDSGLQLIDVGPCGGSCPADLTGEGTLNFFDVSAFLNAFTAQDPVADFTGDSTYNFFDVSAFLGAFSSGCP